MIDRHDTDYWACPTLSCIKLVSRLYYSLGIRSSSSTPLP